MAPLATTIQQDLRLTTEQLKVLAICKPDPQLIELATAAAAQVALKNCF